jgi:hypothetical protein
MRNENRLFIGYLESPVQWDIHHVGFSIHFSKAMYGIRDPACRKDVPVSTQR